jgi:hypothetical protein
MAHRYRDSRLAEDNLLSKGKKQEEVNKTKKEK